MATSPRSSRRLAHRKAALRAPSICAPSSRTSKLPGWWRGPSPKTTCAALPWHQKPDADRGGARWHHRLCKEGQRMFDKIQHIGYLVDDLDKAITWFTNK